MLPVFARLSYRDNNVGNRVGIIEETHADYPGMVDK